MAEYAAAFRDPAAIHASCEDYRAAGSVDLEHDRASRAAGLQVDVFREWYHALERGKAYYPDALVPVRLPYSSRLPELGLQGALLCAVAAGVLTHLLYREVHPQ